MAHLDLKLENLMLGSKYELKLIDFDLSYGPKCKEFRGWGTADYRAPELINEFNLNALSKCDIYSAGIILFVMRSGGILPFKES